MAAPSPNTSQSQDSSHNRRPVPGVVFDSRSAGSEPLGSRAPAIDRSAAVDFHHQEQRENDPNRSHTNLDKSREALIRQAKADQEKIKKEIEDSTLLDRFMGLRAAREKELEALRIFERKLTAATNDAHLKAARLEFIDNLGGVTKALEQVVHNSESAEHAARTVRNGAVVVAATIATGGVLSGAALSATTVVTAVGAGVAAAGTVGTAANIAEQAQAINLGTKTGDQATEDFKQQFVQDIKTGALTSVGTVAGLGIASKMVPAAGGVVATVSRGAAAGATSSAVQTSISTAEQLAELRIEYAKSGSAGDFNSFLKARGYSAEQILKDAAIDTAAGAVSGGSGAAKVAVGAGKSVIRKTIIGMTDAGVTAASGAGADHAKRVSSGTVTLGDFSATSITDQAIQVAQSSVVGAASARLRAGQQKSPPEHATSSSQTTGQKPGAVDTRAAASDTTITTKVSQATVVPAASEHSQTEIKANAGRPTHEAKPAESAAVHQQTEASRGQSTPPSTTNGGSVQTETDVVNLSSALRPAPKNTSLITIGPNGEQIVTRTHQQIIHETPPPIEIPTGAATKPIARSASGVDKALWTFKVDPGDVPDLKRLAPNSTASKATVDVYFHEYTAEKDPANWRVNVRVGKAEFVAVAPEGKSTSEPLKLGEMKLVPKEEFEAAAAARRGGTASPEQIKLLEAGHFIPGKFAPAEASGVQTSSSAENLTSVP